MRLNSIPDSEGDSAGSGDVSDQLGATGRKFFLDMLAWLFHQRAESFRVDYRIAPSLTTENWIRRRCGVDAQMGGPNFPVVSVSNMKRLENSGRSRSRCCSLEPVCGVGVGHDPRGDFKPAAHQSPSARGGVNVGGRCQCARQPSRFSRDGGSGFRGPIIDGDQLQASGGQRSRRGLFNLLIEWKLHQILGSQQHPFEVHLSILWILQQTTTFNQDRR